MVEEGKRNFNINSAHEFLHPRARVLRDEITFPRFQIPLQLREMQLPFRDAKFLSNREKCNYPFAMPNFFSNRAY